MTALVPPSLAASYPADHTEALKMTIAAAGQHQPRVAASVATSWSLTVSPNEQDPALIDLTEASSRLVRGSQGGGSASLDGEQMIVSATVLPFFDDEDDFSVSALSSTLGLDGEEAKLLAAPISTIQEEWRSH